MTNFANPVVPAPALPYATRPNGFVGRLAVHYATFLAVLFALHMVVSGLLLFVVPRFKEIFKDFRVALPPITEWVFSIASFFDDYWGWAMALALVFLLPFPLALLTTYVEPASRRRKLLATLVTALIFVCLALVLIGAVSLYLPQVKLIQAVSGGAK